MLVDSDGDPSALIPLDKAGVDGLSPVEIAAGTILLESARNTTSSAC